MHEGSQSPTKFEETAALGSAPDSTVLRASRERKAARESRAVSDFALIDEATRDDHENGSKGNSKR